MILNSPVLASTPNVPLLVPEYRRLHMDADCELSTTGLKSSTAPLLAVSSQPSSAAAAACSVVGSYSLLDGANVPDSHSRITRCTC